MSSGVGSAVLHKQIGVRGDIADVKEVSPSRVDTYMPKRQPVRTSAIGSIEDVQLPPHATQKLIGTRPISLQIKSTGDNGPVFEWFSVGRVLRQRIYDLSKQQQLPIGKQCVFVVDETGAIIEFTVVR